MQFLRITWSELYRMVARKRTWIGFVAFIVLDILLVFLLNLPKAQKWFGRSMEKSGVLFENYFSGLTVGFVILLGVGFLLCTTYLALVSGDVVAKESEDGNLRLLLARPVSRFQFLLSKFVAVQIYTVVLLLFFGLTCYITASIVRGWTGGFFIFLRTPPHPVAIFEAYEFKEGIWRYFGGVLALGLAFTTVSSIGFMLSCFRIKPAAATIICISIVVADSVLRLLPFLEDYRHWFLSYNIERWLYVMKRPIPWSELINNYAFLFGMSAVFFIVGWINFERRDLKA